MIFIIKEAFFLLVISKIDIVAFSEFQNTEFGETIDKVSGIYEHVQFRWIKLNIKEVMRFVKLFKYAKLKMVKWMEIVFKKSEPSLISGKLIGIWLEEITVNLTVL